MLKFMKKLSISVATLALVCPLAFHSVNTNADARRSPRISRRTNRQTGRQVKPFGAKAYPIKLPKQLKGGWLNNDNQNTSYKITQKRYDHYGYWKSSKHLTFHGHRANVIMKYDFTRKGDAFTKSHGKYMFRKGYRPFALTLFIMGRHNHMHVREIILSKSHENFKQIFNGSYHRVTWHHFWDVANGIDDLRVHSTND